MRKSFKRTMSGVTLLEIMLVLAIAGVIIAMSIRYFQSASANQRMTSGLGNVQAVVGAVESFRMAGNPISDLNNTKLAPFFPNSKMPVSPWTNKELGVSDPQANQYTITMDISTVPVGTSACDDFGKKLAANGPYATTCTDGAATIIVTTS